MQESIITSAMRSFVKTFFAIVGLFTAITLMLILAGSFHETTSILNEPENSYTPEIAANAMGQRVKLTSSAPIILKLNISGVIGTDKLNMNNFRTKLMESRTGYFENNPPAALLLNIQSPGGTVIDADGIYRAIKSYKEQYKIPVYAYVDGLCASGGMYISAAADKVYASDVSLIGSIGVISPPIFNFTKTMDKIGVEALTLSAGIGKDELNSFRSWGPDEGKSYQSIIDSYYNHFVNVMTLNRKTIDKTKLVKDYGAQIFSAKEAEEFGFIDGSGISYNETLKLLAKEIHAEEDQYQVIQLEKKTLLADLLGTDFSILKGQVKHRLEFGADLSPEVMNQFLYLYRPGL